MPRLMTKYRASGAAGALCAVVILATASPAAGQCGMSPWTPSGSVTWDPVRSVWLMPNSATAFSLRVDLTNSVFQLPNNGPVVGFPCRYRVAAFGGADFVQDIQGFLPSSGDLGVGLFGTTQPLYDLDANPVCAEREITVRGRTTLDGFGGSPSIAATSIGALARVVQRPRGKQTQPDGTLRCFPDDTGRQHKFIFKSKSASLGERG